MNYAKGFTLIETMMAVAIFTVVMGALVTMSISFGNSVEVQSIKSMGNDETRAVVMRLVPELRMADMQSINWDELPGPTLTYRIPEDIDGNGLAVDGTNSVEWSAEHTISRDTDDLNEDGLTDTQLIHNDGNTITVLANYIREDNEGTDENGDFTAAQDTNGNGIQDVGIYFEAWGNGLMMTIQSGDETRLGHDIPVRLREIIYPRN